MVLGRSNVPVDQAGCVLKWGCIYNIIYITFKEEAHMSGGWGKGFSPQTNARNYYEDPLAMVLLGLRRIRLETPSLGSQPDLFSEVGDR